MTVTNPVLTASDAPPSAFKRLLWKDDRMILDDIVFRLEDFRDDAWDLGDDCFRIYKNRRMLEQYECFWKSVPAFRPLRMVEVGIYDGGSVAFWNEHFRPKKFVAVDLATRSRPGYYEKYLQTHGLESTIKTYWNTNQADADRLRRIARSEFDGPLDLVIDDASHSYEPTKITFETLFPLLRPGGLYVIEDWSWACWPALPADCSLPHGSELPGLIHEIINSAGTMTPFLVGSRGTQIIRPLIAAVHVYGDFVVVERGPAELADPATFTLHRFTNHRPARGWRHRIRAIIRRITR